jgi:hypothetical protein
MKQTEIEKNNKTDITVSTLKSIVGIAPFIGPALQEAFETFIPNQRLDRLAKFAIELDNKLNGIAKEQINIKMKQESLIDLLEEATIQSTRALSNERISYIASIVKKALTEEEISNIENKHLLNLLKELNDIEIIWLRFYLVPTINGDEDFRKKHNNILEQIYLTLGSEQKEIDKSAIQNSYKEHLSTLGLLKKKVSIKVGGDTNEIETKGYEITPLGKLLLKQIGFKNNEWLC